VYNSLKEEQQSEAVKGSDQRKKAKKSHIQSVLVSASCPDKSSKAPVVGGIVVVKRNVSAKEETLAS
jgi:hypothetical protein